MISTTSNTSKSEKMDTPKLHKRPKRQLLAGLGVITGVVSLLGLGGQQAEINSLTAKIAQDQLVEDVLVHRIAEDEEYQKATSESLSHLKSSLVDMAKAETRSHILSMIDRSHLHSEELSGLVEERASSWAQGMYSLKQGKLPLWMLSLDAYSTALVNISKRAEARGLVLHGNVYDPEFSVVIRTAGIQVVIHLRLRAKKLHEVLVYSG